MYIHVILLATLMKVCHSLLLGSCFTSQSSLSYWPSLLSFFRLIQGLVHDLCLLHKNWTQRKEGPCHITHISNARMFISDPSNSFVNFNFNKLLTLIYSFCILSPSDLTISTYHLMYVCIWLTHTPHSEVIIFIQLLIFLVYEISCHKYLYCF